MNKLEKIIELSKSKGYRKLRDECLNVKCSACSFHKVFKDEKCIDHFEQLLEEYDEQSMEAEDEQP